MRVTAKATRSGDWWAVEVPEVPGVFTQTRRLDQIDAMVRDAVSLMLDGVEPDDVEIVVDPHTALDDVVAEALSAREAADRARQRADELVREALLKLSESGVTVRDSGELFGVSAQRVSQILNSPAMEAMRDAARTAVTTAVKRSQAQALAAREAGAQEVLEEAIKEVERRRSAGATLAKPSKARSALSGRVPKGTKVQ